MRLKDFGMNYITVKQTPHWMITTFYTTTIQYNWYINKKVKTGTWGRTSPLQSSQNANTKTWECIAKEQVYIVGLQGARQMAPWPGPEETSWNAAWSGQDFGESPVEKHTSSVTQRGTAKTYQTERDSKAPIWSVVRLTKLTVPSEENIEAPFGARRPNTLISWNWGCQLYTFWGKQEGLEGRCKRPQKTWKRGLRKAALALVEEEGWKLGKEHLTPSAARGKSYQLHRGNRETSQILLDSQETFQY